ncbi:hypothetical protein [Streptomyces sp. NBC_00102]|uniref:hypothetical protein n=1 Tax=Streptomyces sp. NBC_00102 TaxID=2975652 RepID=UPI00225168CA|nr:hypothetical protein [Streptomyces sp. NBC_00102]MCX5398962.1 hypothetical protein [Streptomyces sp. NBC_00102]
MTSPAEQPMVAAAAAAAAAVVAAAGEQAYRAWLAHTATCATCRVSAACPTSVRLGRAWRKARR